MTNADCRISTSLSVAVMVGHTANASCCIGSSMIGFVEPRALVRQGRLCLPRAGAVLLLRAIGLKRPRCARRMGQRVYCVPHSIGNTLVRVQLLRKQGRDYLRLARKSASGGSHTPKTVPTDSAPDRDGKRART